MRIRAITFDVYGTLLEDARGPLMEVCGEIVQDLGLRLRPDEFLSLWEERFYRLLERAFMRMEEANLVSLESLFQDLRIEADASRYVMKVVEGWGRRGAYPEVRRVLEALSGWRMALVTNADEEFLRRALEDNGLRFERVITSEAMEAYKPDPRLFQAAARELGCPETEVLHVGDSLLEDVAGAKSVGMKAAWVNRPGRDASGSSPRPDFIVGDLEDLLRILP
jgi:2-haloalkanoic acid dehalogenase type II